MGALSRTRATVGTAAGDAFKEAYRTSPRHFTRERSLTCGSVVCALLASNRKSSRVEAARMREEGAMPVSRQAYLAARRKLDPKGIRQLCRGYAGRFYAEEEPRTFKGHLLVAVDGTSVNLPTTPATLARYGNASNGGVAPQAAARACIAVDVLNSIVMDCDIGPLSSGERSRVPGHVEAVREVAGRHPFIMTLDRGYPSIGLVDLLTGAGVPFVMRASSIFLKEEFASAEAAGGDAVVEVAVTKVRLAHARRTDPGAYERLASREAPLTARFALVDIGTGTPERLVTNLPGEAFGTADLAELYRLRWGVETSIRFIKAKLQLENFTGTDPVLIEQDIHAAVWVLNAAFDLANEAEREAAGAADVHGNPKRVNRSFAIGRYKEMFLRIVLSDGADLDRLSMRLVEELKGELVAVRDGRRHRRRKGNYIRQNRYSNTYKPLF